jgi:hypothetical protein
VGANIPLDACFATPSILQNPDRLLVYLYDKGSVSAGLHAPYTSDYHSDCGCNATAKKEMTTKSIHVYNDES